jgi:hypothetical protein
MSFFGQTINGITYTGGGYNDATGQIDEGTPSAFSITGSIQPTTGKDLDAIPENRRSSAAYKIYTASELQIADTGDENSDELTIFGRQYEVIAKLPWRNNLLNHYKYIVSKKEGT